MRHSHTPNGHLNISTLEHIQKKLRAQFVPSLPQLNTAKRHTLSRIPPKSYYTPVMQTLSEEIQAFLEASFNVAAPVGSSPADKEILVNALYSASRNNENYLDAINSLHSVNGHVAAQWKDYYLAHIHEINGLVSQRTTPNITTPIRGAKKPRFPSPSPTPTLNSSTSSSLSSSDSEELPDFFAPNPNPTQASQYRSPGNGVPFTDTDLQLMVAYIASKDNWESLKQASRWDALSLTATPYRSPSAWQAHYRKRKDIIDRLVEEVVGSHQNPANVPPESVWGPPQIYPGDYLLEGSSYETGSTTSSETLSDVPSSDSD
ncbi:hypothetical protein EYR40_003885 [Pleurotus pulmonarius]|nr:hypothetical protein EYR40_003885 [Pleurotus pulmonarius]KAF4606593.1 hypothetical protein EYR38_000647 [Pleurotus pulmonarius]